MTRAALARALNISAERVRALAEAGTIPRDTDGGFDFEAVREALENNLDRTSNRAKCFVSPIDADDGGDAEPTAKRGSLMFEQIKLTRAKRKAAEYERQELERRLLDAEKAEMLFAGTIQSIRDALFAIPDGLCQELVGIDDPRAIRDKLMLEFRQVMKSKADDIRAGTAAA